MRGRKGGREEGSETLPSSSSAPMSTIFLSLASHRYGPTVSTVSAATVQ
jgi:hypothetical protein